MAGRGAGRPPYAAVRALGAWAALNRSYFRGRLLLAGHRLEELSLCDLLDVSYVLLSDGINGLVDAQEVRAKLDEAIDATWIEAETWGVNADVLDSIPQAPPRRVHDGARPTREDAPS